MEMSKVIRCDVNDCAYNMDNTCHAMAITIGDSMNPKCDTFCPSMTKGGDYSCTGSVGACKVHGCIFNTALECQSPEISVGYLQNEPDCLTFEAR